MYQWTIKYLFFLFLCIPVVSVHPESYVTQIIMDTSDVVSLGTYGQTGSTRHTWWATDRELDPEIYSHRAIHPEFDPSLEDEMNWQPVQTPANLIGQGNFQKQKGHYWYLKTFRLSEKQHGPLSIRLGIISDSDRVYLNGHLIGKTGDMNSDQPRAYDKVRIYDLPSPLFTNNGINVILVEVKNYFEYEAGIKEDSVKIGSTQILWSEFYHKNYGEIFFLIVYLTVGGYFTFLFFRRLKDYENLLFGVFILLLILYQLFRNQLKYETGLDFFLMKRLEYTVLFLLLPVFYYFVRLYFRLPDNRFVRIWDRFVAFVAILMAFMNLLIWGSDSIRMWDRVNTSFVQLFLWPVFIIGSPGIMIYRAIKLDRDALYMLMGNLFVVAAVVIDVLSTRGYFNLPRIMGFVFFAFIISLAIILANRFVRLNDEVEDLNANLEQKVQSRTLQLRNSLKEIQELKEQQDGDYFLTSLLIKPLGGNYSTGKTVTVEMKSRQIKSFHFRKYSAEIGGDLNIAHTIELRHQSYTVFLNGDAMGKSIQGAGGALVLGTVFKSIINRSKQSSHAREVFPEQWIKQCYLELQSVFVSFDGSMMISMVLGMVDDATGLLYYINAEHPWTVLYRDGKARFIEKDLSLRKIGVDNMGIQPVVKTFQMTPGDVILAGSDGRDDILLGYDDQNKRIINEDESLFLRIVEDAKSDLDEIESNIINHGELTDDFTLIRISYLENRPAADPLENHNSPQLVEIIDSAQKAQHSGDLEKAISLFESALQIDPNHPYISGELARLHSKTHNYARAATLAESYLEHNPSDSEYIYLASFAFKQSHNLEKAADYGERYRLRDPEMVLNLVNLADVYHTLGNVERAEILLQEALRLEPDNKWGIRLGEVMKTEQSWIKEKRETDK